MKELKWIFPSLLLLFGLVACNDDELEVDTEMPGIIFTAPADGTEITPGGENNDEFLVFVDATVTDNIELEEVTLWVTPPGGQAQLIFTEDVDDFLNDNREADIEETISLGTTANAVPGNYVFLIRATDAGGNVAEVARSVSVAEQSPGEAISVQGIEEGQTFETLGGEGVPATFTFEGEEGIDSVNVSARTTEGDLEILNRGFGEDFFDENNIDNSGDFSFQDNLEFPNTSLARGKNTLNIRTFRNGEMVDERNFTTNLEPAAGTMEVAFSASPAVTLPEGSRVFTSGNFVNSEVFTDIDDPAFELMEDPENPGTFGTTIFADPDRDVNFRFARMDADGTAAFEVDEECLEVGPDFRTFSPATDEEIAIENVNFPGLGDCE